MRLEIINTVTQFENISNEWNALLDTGASHVPFLRNEYLSTWWRTLGGGEWESAEMLIIVARGSNNELIGIAPLFYTDSHEGKPTILFMGSIEISDFLDLIISPAYAHAFIKALFERLDTTDMPKWHAIDLYNILDSSPTLPALRSAAENFGWKYQQQCLQHSPFIPLPGDWETYLGMIDKKQRHEIRRKMRRMESSDVAWRWYIVEDDSTLDSESEAFLKLMAYDLEKQRFLTDAMRSHMLNTIAAAFEAGSLQLAFLEIEQQKAAGYLNFDFDNHLWIYNSGIDFQFRDFSPGWVLLAHLIKWANDHKRKSVDFMRGDEDYKYRFGGIDRFVVRARIER